jgi:hypothetical protein
VVKILCLLAKHIYRNPTSTRHATDAIMVRVPETGFGLREVIKNECVSHPGCVLSRTNPIKTAFGLYLVLDLYSYKYQ